MAVSNRSAVMVAAASALATALVTAGVFRAAGSRTPSPSERAHEVHAIGATVMLFALERTTHVFEMTERGGVQDVVSKEPEDTATIRLIRRHLMHEAERFRQGDFGDPRSLHGEDMPGLHQLSAGTDRLRVAYDTVPDGARITFSTEDPVLVTAVHRWFGAQLSDHAADATYR